MDLSLLMSSVELIFPPHHPQRPHHLKKPRSTSVRRLLVMAMFRLSASSPRATLRGMRPIITHLSRSTRFIIPDSNADPCNPRFQGRRGFSTPCSDSKTPEQAAAIAGSYFDEPMNVRYHDQVWGEGMHVGRYDLLEGTDAKLEGLDRIKRATALTREVVINKVFPQNLGPSDELTMLEMGSGVGTLAREAAKMKQCKVVCIEVSSRFNAINATRSKEAGLADSILIPGERSIFETGMPTASMDGVVSTDCFAHIDGDTDSVMKEAARVLKRGSFMAFTTHMQPDTSDATALAKVNREIGVTKLGSPETFKESGKRHSMGLVEFEDQTSNLIIHYQNMVDRIASVRGTLEDVDDEMLDARSARCSLFVDAGKRGLMIWGTSVYRKDED